MIGKFTFSLNQVLNKFRSESERILIGKAAFGLNQVLKIFRSESVRILIQDNKEFYFYIEEIPCSDSDQGLIQTESKLPYCQFFIADKDRGSRGQLGKGEEKNAAESVLSFFLS